MTAAPVTYSLSIFSMHDSHSVGCKPFRNTSYGVPHPPRVERLAESFDGDNKPVLTRPSLYDNLLLQSRFLDVHQKGVPFLAQRLVGIQ